LLVVATILSAGYYLPVVMAMYMKPESSEQSHVDVRLGRLAVAVVTVAVAGLLGLGVQPSGLLGLAQSTGASVRAAAVLPSTPPAALSTTDN
jgi:NADH:ubiquinone oxidoreductase subunit 2 (subunit N)